MFPGSLLTQLSALLPQRATMLQILWDTRSYFFWLLAVSFLCFILERLWPWRRQQRALRPQITQDLF